MAKSIWIMLAIAVWYDYEIWQMDVKTAFLNGFVEEEIYMDQQEEFKSDDDDAKSQSGFVFKLNGGVVAWKSSKQDTTTDSTMEAGYIVALEAAKEAVWMKNYIQELGVVPSIAEPVVIFCNNNGSIPQAKELSPSIKQRPPISKHDNTICSKRWCTLGWTESAQQKIQQIR
ncbi:UNVERIFIED_CONTAM: Retrovirus-related Pol polyprotein from transposon TNT 1-94 [Sesamum calycinum]|uniref:Retrovirus-related Pol polyprotein from transposon TNT 1-94 n=1 Tax=Sesamum calycinum TaxID=2727403 RepID=A0AAW2Q2Q0_9LAMI